MRGAASLRRKPRLQRHLADARELVQTLKRQAKTDPGAADRRAQAARLRAAQEREQRIAQTLARLPELEAAKRRNSDKAEDARASTTDADATNMKMADGGFRPAYNIQLATDCASQVIVGVDATTVGSEFEPKRGDGDAVAQWSQRMNTDAAREIYKERAASAECVNAQARNRGLQRLPVRGSRN